MTGLRERQKADRRHRILRAARTLFADAGPDSVTIEAIADRAGVSGVTVHNYYGTKSGVLLALVAESDRELIDRMGVALADDCADPIKLSQRFAATIRAHAITFLDKQIWRQVIAASITDTTSPFGKSYRSLDEQLAMILVDHLTDIQRRGGLAESLSVHDLGKALFNVQNMHFIHFISSDDMSDEDAESALLRDVQTLLSVRVAPSQ